MQADYNREDSFSIKNVTRITDFVISRFVKNGSVSYDSFDEVKQNIISKYLEKQDRIANAYSGNAKVDTYLSSVFYRMILEYLRSQNNYSRKYCDFYETYSSSTVDTSLTPELKMIIESESTFLNRVLSTYGTNASKINVYCKVYYRINVTRKELVDFCGKDDADWAMTILNNDFKSDNEVYTAICTVHNRISNKIVKADAIRMFINTAIKTLVSKMNINGRANYDRESLGILIELIARNYPTKKKLELSMAILLLFITIL